MGIQGILQFAIIAWALRKLQINSPMQITTRFAKQAGAFFAAWRNGTSGSVDPASAANTSHSSMAPNAESKAFNAITLEAWRSFFATWPTPQANATPRVHKPRFNIEQFSAFAPAFRQAADTHRERGTAANLWKVTGLGHDELRNSEVLAWFLNAFAEHGQGSRILEIFLATTLAQGNPQAKIQPEDVRNGPYWTNTESLPLGDMKSRVDIEIESPSFLLFIEVKIRAPETGDQLERYVDLIQRKAGNRRWQVVFLTPQGREARNLALGPHVSSISWKQFGTAIAAHLDKEELGVVPTVMLRHYADYVQTLS